MQMCLLIGINLQVAKYKLTSAQIIALMLSDAFSPQNSNSLTSTIFADVFYGANPFCESLLL